MHSQLPVTCTMLWDEGLAEPKKSRLHFDLRVPWRLLEEALLWNKPQELGVLPSCLRAWLTWTRASLGSPILPKPSVVVHSCRAGFGRWRQSGHEFKVTFSYEQLRATLPSGHSVINKEISKLKGTHKNIFHIVKIYIKLRTEGEFWLIDYLHNVKLLCHDTHN